MHPPSPRSPTASLARDFLDETGAPQYLVRLLPCADSCFFLDAADPPDAGVGLPRHAASAAAAASLKELSGAVATNKSIQGTEKKVVLRPSHVRPESTKETGRPSSTNDGLGRFFLSLGSMLDT